MRRIWRLLHFFGAVLWHTVYASLAVRFRPEEERPAFRARCQQAGSRTACRILGVRVSMRGLPPRGKPMLFVCNHLGLLDPFVLGSQMLFSSAGKAEIRKWPLVGWMCRAHGMLFVDRRRAGASAFVDHVQQRLREGVSVLVFPEGTTGWGDAVLPFKTAAFQAVAGGDEAVLPLYLNVLAVNGEPTDGGPIPDVSHNDKDFVEHSWHLLGLKRVDVEVCVGEPVATAGRNRKELARLAHEVVSELGGHTPAENSGTTLEKTDT